MTPGNRLLMCLSIIALTAGCSGAGSPSPSEAATPSATQSATAFVYGTQTCTRTSYDEHEEGDNEITVEHFRCTDQVNDPRIGEGQLDADVTTTFEPADSPAARWEATVTITTAEGLWTAENYRGSLVFWADASGPYNYAEGTFIGSGAYEGLVYHELMAGSNAVLTVTGSIERAE